MKNTSLYRRPEGLAITTLWACPNSNPKTLTSDSQHICTWSSCFPSHHYSLQSSMLPSADHGYYAPLPFTTASCSLPCFPPLTMGTSAASHLLSFILNTSALSLLFLYEGSWALLSSPLPWMQWLSSLFSATALSAVVELSLLGRSGTVCFWLSCPDIATFPVAAGPCSNKYEQWMYMNVGSFRELFFRK